MDRHSTVRRAAGLEVVNIGAPIDVLWMRISRLPDDPVQSLGRIGDGRMMVTIDRGDYWQCAFVIRKGEFDEIRAQGLDAFRAQIAALAPYMRDRLGELAEWDDVKLLTVTVDRLRRWHRPGLLCIGDAAHAMSPIGGVGINLAIQDAVATANILATALSQGGAEDALLDAVQRRRTFPTVMTQRMQVFLQDRILRRVLAGGGGGRGGCRCCSACCGIFRRCGGFPRGSWAWGSGRNMCGSPRVPVRYCTIRLPAHRLLAKRLPDRRPRHSSAAARIRSFEVAPDLSFATSARSDRRQHPATAAFDA